MKKKLTKKQIKKNEKREIRKKDKEWAKLVKERWNNRCTICWHKFGVINTRYLNAHHIVDRYVKELRHDLINGVAICPRHHAFDKFYSAHRNPLWFLNWMYENNPNDMIYLMNKLKEIENGKRNN